MKPGPYYAQPLPHEERVEIVRLSSAAWELLRAAGIRSGALWEWIEGEQDLPRSEACAWWVACAALLEPRRAQRELLRVCVLRCLGIAEEVLGAP